VAGRVQECRGHALFRPPVPPEPGIDQGRRRVPRLDSRGWLPGVCL